MVREVAGLEMVARLTGEPHGDRRPIIAGGWLEVAVEMVSLIDRTVLLRRTRAGMGVVPVLSPPRSRRVPMHLREAAASPGCGELILARAGRCHSYGR